MKYTRESDLSCGCVSKQLSKREAERRARPARPRRKIKQRSWAEKEAEKEELKEERWGL